MRLTLLEMKLEYDYRVSERVGIICGAGPVTPQAESLGEQDAQEWLEAYSPRKACQGVLL